MPDASGSVDLSKVQVASSQDDIDLANLSDEEQAALEQMAALNPDAEPEGLPVRTAFLVIVGRDGTVEVTPDINAQVVRDLVPSADDVYGALQTAAKDIEIQENSLATASAMHQMAMAQMAQRQNAQLAAGLNLGKH
jgi:succinate dehydrogenase/fumarate reductase-like Fe-S protein